LRWWGNLYRINGKQNDVHVDEIIIHPDLYWTEREIGKEGWNYARSGIPTSFWVSGVRAAPCFSHHKKGRMGKEE